MAKDLEIEFKNLLTEQEYSNLLSEYNLTDSLLKSQTNFYFDTPNGLLRQAKMGLRIRETTNKIEFTLKVPTENEHSYLEITDYLTSFDFDSTISEQLIPDKSDVLTYLKEQNFPIDQLENIGELTTVRGEKIIAPGILLVLDKSTYYGLVDYELEMEVSDSGVGKAFFLRFLDKHQIVIRPAKKKIRRMFERKNELFE